jgi:cell wall-associated NlpC family hydrolase
VAARNTSYNGLCLTFDFNAYSAANVNPRQWVNFPITSSTYPQDIWGHFTHGITGTGTPPPGALVFFNATSGHSHIYSHVELSTGGGNMISTSDTVAGYSHSETLAEHAAVHPWNSYVGWWLPA